MYYSIQDFNFLELAGHDIRFLYIDGKEYYIGKDVATALGYKRPDNAISTHVDDNDKTYALIKEYDSNRKHQMVVINKAGLYSIIYSTKLPQAREIQRWIASKIMSMVFEDEENK